SGLVNNPGTLTFNNNNTITADLNNSGTINVIHQNNSFNGALATTETSLLNLDIIQNANPQITFATGFTNHGNIELNQSIAYGRTTALAITNGTLINSPLGTIASGGVNGARGILADFENRGQVFLEYTLTIDSSSAYNAPGGVFEGSGSLTMTGTNLVNGGHLSPGILDEEGQLALFGDFEQEEQGVFSVRIGGLDAGTQYDKMVVTNAAVLNGTLAIELADDFSPAYGDSFIIVDHDSRMGEFSALSGLDIGNGLLFNIAYRPGYVVLAAGDFLPPATRIITASAGVGGEISPDGDVYIPDHGEVTFAINPIPGYGVGDVLVDGLSVGPAALYHFADVTADHTIDAFFTPSDFEYEQINIGSVTDMNGVDYGDREFGVIVGDGGEIRITNDGGLSWWAAEHGVTSNLNDVQVIGDIIFVVGESGTVCISYDGGVTWMLSPTGVSSSLTAIEMVHSGYGYAIGDDGTLLCWDGISGWSPQTVPGLPAGSDLTDITIVDGIVYVVGSNGLVIRRDSPQTDWAVMWSGQGFHFEAVSFYNGNSGYAVGSGGQVWHTINGGLNWSAVDVGAVVNFHDCLHYSEDVIYIVGDGKFIRTTDSGLSWHEIEFPNGDGFQALTIAQCRGVVTGLLGETYEYETEGCVEEPGAIQGFVLFDGVGQESVTINLKDADGVIVESILSDSEGFYEYLGLAPQFYSVEVIPPHGYVAETATHFVLVRAHSTARLDFVLLSTSGVEQEQLPQQVSCGAYPNPFNPMTTIKFDLPRQAEVSLEIYDSAGRRVNRLLAGQAFTAGRHTLSWRGVDGNGRQLASGIYHYRLQAGQEHRKGKLTLLK
ncbi:MAG: T9SS type A sorting domain-containing protein, partial [bacterium]|nr:T9SS type A sorting domain-containing protein [bacterium]